MTLAAMPRTLGLCGLIGSLALGLATLGAQQGGGTGQGGAGGGRGRGPAPKLSDPVLQDAALKGAIDLHAHQDPDSNGPSYGQAARSVDALDLVKRAKDAGMRGFVIKQHLDQTAGLAYYIRKLHPDMEVYGGMGSNLTTGPKVNPWAIAHMTEIKGGWGRIVWMPSWDSETSSHRVKNFKQPAFLSVATCPGGGLFWANYPKPCPNGELLPEVKEAMKVIATKKTRDSNGDLILATGHQSFEEGKMMVQEAVRAGVKRIIVTHPLLEVCRYTPEQIKEIVSLGPEVYAEFVSSFGRENAPPERLEEYVHGIRAAGVENSFVSSDTGQLGSPFQPDALAMAARALRKSGFTEAELDTLFKINPAKVLGIAPPGTSSAAP
jgi:hypothetical protein